MYIKCLQFTNHSVKHQQCSDMKSFLHVQVGLIAFQLMTTISSIWKKVQQQCNFSQNNFQNQNFLNKLEKELNNLKCSI